jgi:ferritin-like protein
MSNYIEPVEELDASVRDNVRALTTLKEEVEAVIWYQQRAAACADGQLRKVVEHNMNEEIEHACMALEWLRRNMNGWEEQLKTYLFKTQEITEIEESGEGESEGLEGGGAVTDLGIGSLKKKE